MVRIDQKMAEVEKTMNLFDYIPFIAPLSGHLRMVAGSVQVIVGPIFGLLKALLTTTPFLSALYEGYIYGLHGAANICRGFIASIPILNLALYLNDVKCGRVNYPRERLEKGVYPLMPTKLAQ